MTSAVELAKKLDGCVDISKELIKEAAENDLVIVYGYSDDNIEIDGAISEEIGAFDGGVAYFYHGEVITECDNPCDHCSIADERDNAMRVFAHWSQGGYSWVMEAADGLEAYPFDMLERGEDDKFCRGLVFDARQIQ